MIICTTVDKNLRLMEFSRAEYIVLYDFDKNEIIEKKPNPARWAKIKRPAVARECVKVKPDIVLAPHGSTCFPSYRIFRNAHLKVVVDYNGKRLTDINPHEITMKEVIYSSLVAVLERFH